MQIGDLIYVPYGSVHPIPFLGNEAWKQSFELSTGSIGVVLDFSDWWGDDYCRVLFPEGIGWVKRKYVMPVT